MSIPWFLLPIPWFLLPIPTQLNQIADLMRGRSHSGSPVRGDPWTELQSCIYMGVWWSQPWLISLYFFQRGQIPSNTSSDFWLISLHFVKRGKIPVTPPLILGNPPMPLRVPSEGGSMAIPHCKRSHLYSPMAYNILINGYGYIIRL